MENQIIEVNKVMEIAEGCRDIETILLLISHFSKDERLILTSLDYNKDTGMLYIKGNQVGKVNIKVEAR